MRRHIGESTLSSHVKIPLPKAWPGHVRTAVLHAIAMADWYALSSFSDQFVVLPV